MDSTFYKYCVVPKCKSTSVMTPNKLFVRVPNNEQIRRKWLKLARRDDAHSLSLDSRMYFCEDHFDLPNDMINYMEYHIMGNVPSITASILGRFVEFALLNPDCIANYIKLVK